MRRCGATFASPAWAAIGLIAAAACGGDSPTDPRGTSAVPTGTGPVITDAALAFLSDRDGTDSIYLMNPDGSGVTRITQDGDHYFDPVWVR